MTCLRTVLLPLGYLILVLAMAYLPGSYHEGAYESGLSGFGDDYYDYGSRPGDSYLSDPYGDPYYGEEGLRWAHHEPYYPDLDFVHEPIGVYDAWGDESWDADQVGGLSEARIMGRAD